MSSKNITAATRCEHCGAKLDESRTAGLGYAYDKALHDIGVAHTPEGCSICQGAES